MAKTQRETGLPLAVVFDKFAFDCAAKHAWAGAAQRNKWYLMPFTQSFQLGNRVVVHAITGKTTRGWPAAARRSSSPFTVLQTTIVVQELSPLR